MMNDKRMWSTQGKTIRWLHISDLHFNSDDMSTSELRSAEGLVDLDAADSTVEALWNQRSIPIPVQEHIRNMSGRYWTKKGSESIGMAEVIGVAEAVHRVGIGRDDVHNLVRNLLNCFPYTEDSGTPDYSGLDLRGIQIPNVKMERVREKVSLRGCLIDEMSIGKNNKQPTAFSFLQFSPDNAYLVAYGNQRISIYSLLNDNNPFVYTIGADISRLGFCKDYLFAVTRGSDEQIMVFSKNNLERDDWRCVGIIAAPSEAHYNLLNNRLHNIILSPDDEGEYEALQNGQESGSSNTLHFYYNNREIVYSLRNCERIGNYARQHAWENQIDGIDITFLAGRDGCSSGRRGKKKKKHLRENGINYIAEHKGLRAEAALDGGLIVYSGAEVYHILERGTTLLKDGAISGDGSTAVTLSYNHFKSNRRVQVWDLNGKRRISELRCPGEIDRIHMSDSGRWIIGIAGDRTWTYDRENDKEEWYNEHFISSQRSKVSSYGDKVVRKVGDRLCLFDLGSKKSESVDDKSGSGNIACIMEDGSLATTDKRGRVARFRNTGTGECSAVNSQPTNVIGIQDLRGKPFIAVATQDNMISIYHTRTCQRTRKLQTKAGNFMMVVHPDELVIANSNGHRLFETNNYYEKDVRGWWYTNQYKTAEHPIHGDVLDLAFNTKIHELMVILSNGEILYCHEKYCRYHGSTDIIISFNMDTYDFRGCKCNKKIREMLYQNGAEVEKWG